MGRAEKKTQLWTLAQVVWKLLRWALVGKETGVYLVVRSHQVLHCLAICRGDFLDIGSFLLSRPSPT